MRKIEKKTAQDWLPFEKIFDNGIFIYKGIYLKIIRIMPINYDLKSNLEKEAILNSYKLFLKTCDFDIQLLIQSKKEDLKNHISKIKEEGKKQENIELSTIYQEYIEYIKKLNDENKSSSKNFYILVNYEKDKDSKNSSENFENIIINILNEKYFKIKECLSRCGNIVYDVNSKEEIINIFYSFYNCRKNLNNNVEGE